MALKEVIQKLLISKRSIWVEFSQANSGGYQKAIYCYTASH
jgi:hypothetical protein